MARWLTVALFLSCATAHAHPVPKQNHDRVIVVHITPDALIVDYRLELDLDGWTVTRDTAEALKDRDDELVTLTSRAKVYEAFARAYSPLLAGNLRVRLDGREVELDRGPAPKALVTDSILFPFVYRKSWKLRPGERHHITIYEGNYETDEGQIKVSVVGAGPIRILEKSEADEATKNRSYAQRLPGDEKRLRGVSATFELGSEPATEAALADSQPVTEETPQPAPSRSLLDLLFDSELGFWSALGLAFILGAGHALTPGHGKTLVAAYLVGERGTVWHALLLGLTTTLTHTGSVLILALALALCFPRAVPGDVQPALELVSGLLVVGLGFWLLLRRLAGQPDHVHIGGGHHHHHEHGHGDHLHDDNDHGHTHPLPGNGVGMWGLVVLGVSGGLVPCTDAIFLLGSAIKVHRPWYALPFLLSFSAGLASTLVAVGISVVYGKGLAAWRWGESRLFRALPLVSAVIVLLLGLWLCYDSLHSHGAHSSSVATQP